MFDKLIKKLDILEALVDKLDDKDITRKYTFLCERIANPDFFAVFLGETSSGKSTIINGLLTECILPIGTAPTTGVVTEVAVNRGDNKFYALSKNAVLTEINRERFKSLCFTPDSDLLRLILHKNLFNSDLKGVRVFDTPGYGAIIKEHEEVLKQFLPNSDIVIYTLDYKIGILEYDFTFLRAIKELLRDESIPIVVVINMCPKSISESDRRIQEISKYAKDIIGKEPKIFSIPRIIREKASTAPILPDCTDLWKYIATIANSQTRQKDLYDSFDGFISDLYSECLNLAEVRYEKSRLNYEEERLMSEEQKKYADSIMTCTDIIKETFARIRHNMDDKLSKVVSVVQSDIDSEIDAENKTNVIEMIAFTNSHLLPFSVNKQRENIVDFYLETELNDLNERVNNLINNETHKFQSNLSVNPNSSIGQFAEKLVTKIVGRFAEQGLTHFFAQYGGVAGAGAGVANAASHLLKRVGDIVGKTFSKETHNALKHYLAKIGFTSSKAIGAAVTVLIEATVYLIRIHTWKSPLKNKVKEGLSKWKKEALPMVIEDLNKLEEENIQTINNIVNTIKSEIEYPDYKSANDLFQDVAFANEIGNKLKSV